jgi:hypothetical protein
MQGDVTERRGDQFGVEEVLVLFVGELEEREGAAVGEAEEAVAVGADRAEELVLL